MSSLPFTRWPLSAVLAALHVAHALPALAQDASPAERAGATAALEEVVVTARKREERLQDVPDTITAFTEAQIERAGIDELRDYVRLTPGLSLVEASQSPGIALINIRGIGQQYQSEAPVAVVIDGVQTASVSSINQALVDVERIEVLKGPQGALYGRNAIGGAINITTRQPTDELEGRLTVGYADGETLEAVLSGPIVRDRVRFRVAGTYEDFEGTLRNEVTGEYVNPLQDASLRARLIADLSDVVRLDLRAGYANTENAGYQSAVLPNGDTDDFSTRPRSGRPGSGEREAAEYSAKLSVDTGIGELAATSAYVDTEDRSEYDLDQQPIPFLDLNLQLTTIEAWSQELRLTSPSERALRYTAGLYYLDTRRGRETVVEIIPFGLLLQTNVRDDNEAWAAFAQLNYDLTERLELTLAGRYDEDRRNQTDLLVPEASPAREVRESFSMFQPKASLAFTVSPALNLYVTGGQGFRSGGFNAPGPAFRRIYDAEETTSLEAGAKGTLLGGALRFSFAVFQTDYEDQQIQLLDLATGIQGIVNIDETRNAGVELELSALLGGGVTVSAGVGYLDSEIERFTREPTVVGNRAPYTPEWTLNAAIDYAAALAAGWELLARAAVSGQSGMFYEYFSRERNAALGYQLDEQPTYALVDTRLTLRKGPFGFTAFAENLFDEKYYADAASNIITLGLGELGIRGRERRYGLELSYRF